MCLKDYVGCCVENEETEGMRKRDSRVEFG